MKAVENEIQRALENFETQRNNIGVLKRIFQRSYIDNFYKGFAESISDKIEEYKRIGKIENFVGNVLSFY